MSVSFVKKVVEMRAAQKRYFKERTQSALVESKQLEKDVDAWAEFLLVNAGKATELGLNNEPLPSPEELDKQTTWLEKHW